MSLRGMDPRPFFVFDSVGRPGAGRDYGLGRERAFDRVDVTPFLEKTRYGPALKPDDGTLASFVATLLNYTAVLGFMLIIGSVLMWIIFSATVFAEPFTPTCLHGATPDKEFAGTGECVLTVHFGTRCKEDAMMGLATMSELAARWPHAVALLVGAAVTALFISVFICDVWRQKPLMLATSWIAFQLFWGVISTSQFDCDDELRTVHFVMSAGLVAFSTLYAFFGTVEGNSSWRDPAYGYIASSWSPWYLWAPMGLLVLLAVLLYVSGYLVWALGARADGGGSDYDFWRNAAAILEVVFLLTLALYVLIFSLQTSEALGAVSDPGRRWESARHPMPHRCVHEGQERRGQRAWRLVFAR